MVSKVPLMPQLAISAAELAYRSIYFTAPPEGWRPCARSMCSGREPVGSASEKYYDIIDRIAMEYTE